MAYLLAGSGHKLMFGSKIKAYTPHDIKTVLGQKAGQWLTDSRTLKYELVFLGVENLDLAVAKVQNPAQFLYGEPAEDLEHCCLEVIDLQTKIREDLQDQPLPDGEMLFVDGSSRVVEGKHASGYAVVDGKSMQVLEKGRLLAKWSAQSCEIFALKRGLQSLKRKRGTIFTDSKYAYVIVHTFGKSWQERGYLNSKGKTLIHESMVREVLKALEGPDEIAVVCMKGHQRGTSTEIKGNNLADQMAKEAALEEKEMVLVLVNVMDELDGEVPIFSEKEQEEL